MAKEIIAILSKSQYQKVINGQYGLEVPYGVNLANKAGSRSLYFTCEDEDEDAYQELTEGLDASGISWQDVFTLEKAARKERQQEKNEKTKNRIS
jgi:hypothetical protein